MDIEELENLSEKLSMDDLTTILKLKSKSDKKFPEQFNELVSDIFEWEDYRSLLFWLFLHDMETYNNVIEDIAENEFDGTHEYHFFKADTMVKEEAFEKFLESLKGN
jgi:hypothetical protein